MKRTNNKCIGLMVAVILSAFTVSAQKYDVSFGQEFTYPDKKSFATSQYYMGKDKDGYYAMRMKLAMKPENYKYFLLHYSNDHKQTSTELVNEASKGKTFFTDAVKIVSGVPIKFYSVEDKKTKKTTHYAQPVLNASAPAKMLSENYRSIRIVQDDSHETFSAFAYSTEENGKLTGTYTTYTSALDPVSTHDVSLTFDKDYKMIGEVKQVDDLLIMVCVRYNVTGTTAKFDLCTYVYDLEEKELTTFKSSIKDLEILPLSTSRQTIQNFFLNIKGDQLYIVSQALSENKFYGIAYTRINLSELQKEEDRVIKFTDEQITAMKSADPKKEDFSSNLEMGKLFIRSNGDAVMTLESRMSDSKLYCFNIVVLTVNNNAALESVKLIEKKQVSTLPPNMIEGTDAHMSYNTLFDKDELYIFLNDAKGKYIEGEKKKRDELRESSEGVFVAYKLDKANKLTWKVVCNTDEPGRMSIDMRKSFPLSSNQLLLRTGDLEKGQHGLLTVTP